MWPKIIPVAMEVPIFNFSSLNHPNLKDESLGPYVCFFKNVQSLVLVGMELYGAWPCAIELHT